MRAYCKYFFLNFLENHFLEEERYVFPILGNDNYLVKKAIHQHRRLERLFLQEEKDDHAVSLIEEELQLHVRFEERELFHTVECKITKDEILELHKNIDSEIEDPDEAWDDHFWK